MSDNEIMIPKLSVMIPEKRFEIMDDKTKTSFDKFGVMLPFAKDMAQKKESKIADAINQAMGNYANAIDPCGMCRHREHTNVTEICGQCCYYWGSKFELDTMRQGKKNGVRHE